MFRILAIAAGVVNTLSMSLATITHDSRLFFIGWGGAAFSFYGLIYFTDEAKQMGQTRMGYQSLAMRLRWDLKEEGFTAGDRLPSTKKLAEQHGTTRTTVMRALRILAAEHLVEVIQGRGAYVLGEDGDKGSRTDRPKDRIESLLLRRANEVSSGAEMPATKELMTMFGVSHVTVRRVQIDLAERGIIRQTSTGNYVKA